MRHTKEQLEGMSDFELSCEILRANRDVKCGVTNPIGSTALTRVRYNSFLGEGVESVTFDINNPSDMMPLVFEVGITVGTYDDEHFAFSGFEGGVHEECWSNMVYNSNPLRAAAIVYLLMQD